MRTCLLQCSKHARVEWGETLPNDFEHLYFTHSPATTPHPWGVRAPSSDSTSGTPSTFREASCDGSLRSSTYVSGAFHAITISGCQNRTRVGSKLKLKR